MSAISSRRFVLALALGASLAGPALAQVDAKALFEGRYAGLRAAMQAQDAAAAGQFVTSDYQLTDIRGEAHGLADAMAQAGRIPSDPAHKPVTRILSAAVNGESAAVDQELTIDTTRTGGDGAEHQIEIIVVSSDSWVHRGDAWLLSKSVQKDLTVKRDGEVFMHQGS